MTKNEKSPGGSDILRHEAVAGDGEIAHADDERITAHLTRAIAAPTSVFHELISDRIHVDVHIIPAADDRPFITLASAGMSARPMTMPAQMKDAAEWSLAELCVFLPPDWPLDQEAMKDERNYWPIRLLKTLARLPHDYGTWLGWGHSIPNGDPAQPYAPDTKLSGAIIIPPFGLGEDLFIAEGKPTLRFFQILPVTDAEMKYKLKHGADELLEKLEQKLPDIYGPIDRARKSAV